MTDNCTQASDHYTVPEYTSSPTLVVVPSVLEIRELISNAKKRLRVLCAADFHCGHEIGLTPPQFNPSWEDQRLQRMHAYRATQWEYFKQGLEDYGPFDIAILDGDLIDGRGMRIGGVEELLVDRMAQVRMATAVIEEIAAPEVYIARGTDYHVGEIEDFEDSIANNVGAKRIGDILKIDINGLLFNVRHHIGTSQVPHTRATALLRDWLWDVVWAAQQNDFDRADVIIRAHAHYSLAIDQPGMLAMILPGLQGYGTRYGERRLSGVIHFGFVVFDIGGKEDFTWRRVTYPFPIPPKTVAGRALVDRT